MKNVLACKGNIGIIIFHLSRVVQQIVACY